MAQTQEKTRIIIFKFIRVLLTILKKMRITGKGVTGIIKYLHYTGQNS